MIFVDLLSASQFPLSFRSPGGGNPKIVFWRFLGGGRWMVNGRLRLAWNLLGTGTVVFTKAAVINILLVGEIDMRLRIDGYALY
jgi:hypothetical protein